MIDITIYLLEWRNEKSLYGWSSLGLQYIASVLKKDGHTVYSFVYEKTDIAKIAKDIIKKAPNILGIVLYQNNIEEMKRLTGIVKNNNETIRIITGGHTATLYPIKILKEFPHIDIVISGEGELIFPILSKELYGNLGNCVGITYRDNVGIHKSMQHSMIEDLNLLPLPDYDITEQMNSKNISYLFASVSTSRGCLGNCAFCVEHRVSKNKNSSISWRGRSPENVMKEIENLIEKANGKKLVINFVDGAMEDDSPKHKKRLKKLISLLEEKKWNIAFAFLTRAESWEEVDDVLIKQMKRIGLFSVSIGMESGSEDALTIFGKRSKLEDNIRTYLLFSKNRISVEGFIIMFHPYADLDMLKKTADSINKCNLGHRMESWVNSIYIYPDMKIFSRIVMDGLLIGTDQTGYAYRYGYIDGRVKKVFSIMNVIMEDENVNNLNRILDRSKRAIDLFNIFKIKDCDYLKHAQMISEYENILNEFIYNTSNYYYEIFIDIVHSIEYLNQNHEISVKKWIIYANDNYNIIAKKWLRVEIKLARFGIILV